ncbi:DUF5518 domain-containing protein [Halorarum halobium]|uniref:DUF5518 domain-containing protein n=1 Tax=Halorarum halobium TaxID=3075121 RepID=UPI0028A5DD3C|nr:DUF5518 domain-containing protein [Halobaculum sp. XH14]
MSPSLLRTTPSAWRFALIGAVASLPIAAMINWLPNSEATIGGGIMVIGAFIAGGIAVIRSRDPDDVGFRAGFLGGVVAVLTLIVTVVKWCDGGMAAVQSRILGLRDWASPVRLSRVRSGMRSCRWVGGKHRYLTMEHRDERVIILLRRIDGRTLRPWQDYEMSS